MGVWTKKGMEDSSPAVKVPVRRLALPEGWHFPPVVAKVEVLSPGWLWVYLLCSTAAPCLSARRNVISHCPAWSTQVSEVVTHIKHTDAVQTKQSPCQCELKLCRRDRLPSPCSLVLLLTCAVRWTARLSFSSILMFYCQPEALMCGSSWSSLREFALFPRRISEDVPEKAQSCILLPWALDL